MCLIIIKNPNQNLVPSNMLSEVWERNSDGAGIIYKRHDSNNYQMVKGIMTLSGLEDMIGALKLTKKDFIAYHLRYATSGKIDQAATHPFVIHEDAKHVNALSVNDSSKTMFVMHNGVIHDLNDCKKQSDTQRFIMEYLSQIPAKSIYKDDVIKALVEKFIDGSRLLITHGVHGAIMYGKWHSHNGYLISKPYAEATIKKKKKGQQFDFNWTPPYLQVESDEEWDWVDKQEHCEFCGQERESVYNYETGSYLCTSCVQHFVESF